MNCTRRFFLGGASAFAVGSAFNAGCVTLGGNARMKMGVLSDVHIRCGDEKFDTRYIRKAFAYFRDAGVDAVMIAGDIADHGLLSQLKEFAKAWYDVFPDDRAPDGHHVEKLFVYGNHDIDGWTWRYKSEEEQKKPEVIADAIGYDAKSMARAWEECFHEKFEPIWIKDVKGYKIVGAHWGLKENGLYAWDNGGVYGWEKGRITAFLKEHESELRGPRPFFYTQHAHPDKTCMGPWAWGSDRGETTKALSAFPNAVAFTGHSHYALTDERSIWQGGFTSINTASMRYISDEYNLRDTLWSGHNNWGYRDWEPEKISPGINTWPDGHQGMLVEVGDNEIVLHRRDFTWGESLGDDWVIPFSVKDGDPYNFTKRLKTRVAPEFAKDAKLELSRHNDEKLGDVVDITIPRAEDSDGCRVFEYEVTAHLLADDVDLVVSQKRVLDMTYYLPLSKTGAPTICRFKVADLPKNGRFRFEVRPMECFGKKGEAISVTSEKLTV